MQTGPTSSAPKPKKVPRPKKVTMMDQFWRAKKEQPDTLLFFRMGDFYELFGDDAKVASRELGITLTTRSKGADAMPMAGVPVKAAQGHLMKLVMKGFKVSICEQISDPKTSTGIVERAIVRVVTPGTITEEDALHASESNYLTCLFITKGSAGMAWVDVSTGRFHAAEMPLDRVEDEIARVSPAELLCQEDLNETHPELFGLLGRDLGPRLSLREPWRFERDTCKRILFKQFKVKTLEGYGIDDDSPITSAAGALVEYLTETQRATCEHVRRIERADSSAQLVLDRATRSCLELFRTQRDARREGTLIATIDGTLTPMGGRMMREWLMSPLRDVERITERQRGVAEFVESPFLREDVRELLSGVLDVERLVAKVSTGRANARDVAGLAGSLEVIEPLRSKLDAVYSRTLGDLREALDPLDEMVQRIRDTIDDSPPITMRDGGIVREGFSDELDELRQIAGDGKAWMARFQADESERVGIPGLKIGFNSVFGYYIEVPRGQVERVPKSYIRKQTIKNAERYITPELKEFEGKVLQAEDRSKEMEYQIFSELREAVASEIARILDTARSLAEVDVLAGLAEIAARNRYVAPTVDNGDTIDIKEGRHPVIEQTQTSEAFVPNDTSLNRSTRSLGLITGPNMAGKSTYIRQTALIVLLAQIGSFVPAKEAKIGVVDRIFTRIGSADDIGRGSSTFMVEMVEIANILNNATSRSLLVLDEVGRGTSTFDGLALAWAIVEHVHEKIRARTLFATHYHQLTDLAGRLKGVFNLSVSVREWDDEIVFLHRIIDGGTDRSYGIQVARLAGVPADLITRAKAILADIEQDGDDLAPRVTIAEAATAKDGPQQLALFGPPPSGIEKILASIDINNLTPLEALAKLKELQDLV